MINYRFRNGSFFPFFPPFYLLNSDISGSVIFVYLIDDFSELWFYVLKHVLKFIHIAWWIVLIKKLGVGWMPYFRAHCSDWSSPKILHQVRRSWNWYSLGSVNLQRQRFSVNWPSRCCCCCPTSRSSASGLWNRNKEWCFSMNHSGAGHRQPDRKSVRRSEPNAASSFEGLRSLMLNANDGE